MMIWIMILVFGQRGGITTAEFNSEQACKEAEVQISKMDLTYSRPPTTLCVPKGKN